MSQQVLWLPSDSLHHLFYHHRVARAGLLPKGRGAGRGST